MRPRPTAVPITTRIPGVMRLFSKEYFTRKTIPRKRTKPPIHAKSVIPRNASQSIAGRAGGGGGGGSIGGSLTGSLGKAGFGISACGGKGGGTENKGEGAGAVVMIGAEGTASTGVRADSNSERRRSRRATLFLSLCRSTAPITTKTIGTSTTTNPRQTNVSIKNYV